MTVVKLDAMIAFDFVTTRFVDVIVFIAIETLRHTTVLNVSFAVFNLVLYEKFFDNETIDHSNRRDFHAQK